MPQDDSRNNSKTDSSNIRIFSQTFTKTDLDQRSSKSESLMRCCDVSTTLEVKKFLRGEKTQDNLLCSISICRHLPMIHTPPMILRRSKKIRLVKIEFVYLIYEPENPLTTIKAAKFLRRNDGLILRKNHPSAKANSLITFSSLFTIRTLCKKMTSAK